MPEPKPEPEPVAVPDPIPAGVYLGEVFQTNPALWYAQKRKSKHVVIPDDKRRFDHCYMRAATGGGKTNTLMQIISQDMQDPEKGIILIGSKSQIFRDLLPYVPRERADDLVYFNPWNETEPIIGFNLFAFSEKFDSPEAKRQAMLYRGAEVTTILERSLGDLGVSMKNVVSNVARALLLVPGATMVDVLRLLDPQDNSLRRHVAAMREAAEDLRTFWAKYDTSTLYKKFHENVENRFVQVLQPPLSTVLSVNSIRWHELVRQPKIIFLDFSKVPKGETFDTVSQLTLASIQTAFRRLDALDVPLEQRVPYYMTFDEFDDFLSADESLNEMFRQAREQRCALTLAHQVKDNVPQKLLGVIKGNVGTMIILKINDHHDAGDLAKDMQLHGWEHNQDVARIREEARRHTDDFERFAVEHKLKLGYNTPKEKAAHIEQHVQDIIDMGKGSIHHAVLMNLNPDQGHSVVRIPGENYGISTKIGLFKKRTGEKIERYVEWLISNSKKKYGVQAPGTTPRPSKLYGKNKAEDDEDFLS